MIHPNSPIFEFLNHLIQRADIKRIICVGDGAARHVVRIKPQVEVVQFGPPAGSPDWLRSEADAEPVEQVRFIETDLEQPFLIDQALLEGAIVVCFDVLDQLQNQNPLITTLAMARQHCRFMLITVADRVRTAGFTFSESSGNVCSHLKWSAEEFFHALVKAGFPQSMLFGFTSHSEGVEPKNSILVVAGLEAEPMALPGDFRVAAVINVFNELDIIETTVRYLADQGIDVHVVDNWSDDGSFELCQRLLDQKLVTSLLRFPAQKTNDYEWAKQLEHTAEYAAQLDADWVIHYDADEIRCSPWQSLNLFEAINLVDFLGYTAIDFTILNFRFTQDSDMENFSPEKFNFFEFGQHLADFTQVKAWKNWHQLVELRHGGHEAVFAERRVYPLKFLTKHFSLRSKEQAAKKIFRERLPRITKERTELGWHAHFDQYRYLQSIEPWKRSELIFYDETTFQCEYLLERLSGVGVCREVHTSLNRSTAENLGRVVEEMGGRLAILNQAVAERDGQIVSLSRSIEEIRGSTSWRATAPLRFVSSNVRKVSNVIAVLPQVLQTGGGLLSATYKAVRVFHEEGISGVKARIRFVLRQPREVTSISPASTFSEALLEPISKHLVVPYYIDPEFDSRDVACSTEVSMAVHLHLFCPEMLKEFVSYLNNIPVQYDLFVSVPKSCDARTIQLELGMLLSKAGNVVVEPVPDQGRDVAPMIIQFGKRLAQYEVIAHIHAKRSLHNSAFVDWREDVLTKLMGCPGSSGGRVAHILWLLQAKAKIIYSEGRTQFIKGCDGWAGNYDLAKHLLEKYTQFSISDFPIIESPEGFMFWARVECLRDFLELPLSYSDFPPEPIANDGTLVHALERLILIFASKYQGQCIRIHNGDSTRDYRHYEEQQDYASSLIQNNVKVLSYYLPQFHPIPENDLWHGKGFTEWTKVRAANPLFEGHYQQHIPHSDIGYYLLDSPEVLRRQAGMMQKSGVYGQVFYHYWFSGKLILEGPASLLLSNRDIQMPFCFCWANENWTRRWDGNQSEILLCQNYSAQDAHDFIHCLIPFFRDSRYIKVEDRPVLFVYRPSSIPNSQEYLDIWERECAKVGIKRPYVVAVLTRGATTPKDFGMDAGVERVLHDWTEGAVPEIKNTLHGYQPFNGSVLSYDEVASFYMGQADAKDFTYFRSTVPTWDNTARYGSEAYMLHGSTPQRFQEWMESSIAYTQSTLPQDRRFVLVNAWNEWAEGAHLEPDSRFGYSYLNSVGRALSGIPYSGDLNCSCSIPAGTRVHLSFPGFILDKLWSDNDLKERFIFCLSRSSVFNACSVSMNAPELMKDMPVAVRSDSDDADFIVEFRQVSLFDSSVIEKMIQTACASGSAVIANGYDSNFPLLEVTANASVHSIAGDAAPLLVLPKTSAKFGCKNVRMRTDARCIAVHPSEQSKMKPAVTTIVRFHKSAEFNELRNALFCLSAMMDCVVRPLIAAQDLSKQQIVALETMLNGIPWTKGFAPQVHLYHSRDGRGDLRAKMLNESLRKVETRYAAFLDFDDLLLPYAYSWLINRLEKTGKAVTFGRVYSTSYDSANGLLMKRSRVYEYGYSYEEFVGHNHAPLHSFMLDMERLDLSHVVYYEDQRYMEDYLLTLQLFTKDNGDWDSLKEDFFLGDYIHSVDRVHTLAFLDEEERQAMLANAEYRICEQRIHELRKKRSSILSGDEKLRSARK